LLFEAGLITDPTDTGNEIVGKVVELKKQAYRELIAKGQEASPGAISLIKKTSVRMPGKLGIVTAAHAWEVAPFLTRHRLNPYFPSKRIISVEDLS
jgi:phosphoglycolate phosphatase-like HAD superfamily hydrolase